MEYAFDESLMTDITSRLFEIGVIKIGDYVLKSGDRSPFYLDLRLIPSDPEIFEDIVDLYAQLVQSIDPPAKYIAGIMSAGIPFATGIALKLKLPLLQIRKAKKDYGTSKLMEGILPPKGANIVLVDDLISTGQSKIDAIQPLREMGYKVSELVVLLDRTNNDARAMMEQEGIRIHAVGDMKQFLSWLARVNTSNKSEIEAAIAKWDHT